MKRRVLCAIVGAVLFACTTFTPDTTLHDGVSSGADAGADAPLILAPPAGCDPDAEPKDAPNCLVSGFAVFANAQSGHDENPGTKDQPTKTIGAALTKLNGARRVYVCDGTYDERVKLPYSVSIYGGFDCGSWIYNGTKPKIHPRDVGIALDVRAAATAMQLADVDIEARDAGSKGESSIAVFVVQSANVLFRRVRIAAGRGADGDDGLDVADFAPAAAPPGEGLAGSRTVNPKCPTSYGGAGAKNATPAEAGQILKVPEYPPGNIGTPAGCSASSDGSYGAAGARGTGALVLGKLLEDGWHPASGTSGGSGEDGQGGAGEPKGSTGLTPGSGGAGGCGGKGGPPGSGGGASIALVTQFATVAIERSTLMSRDAGNGGRGGNGQKAQLGGQRGARCAGAGGVGGSGGGGGGGAGGVSAGVLYLGTPPRLEGVSSSNLEAHPSVTLGKGGAGGANGAAGEAALTIEPPSRAGEDGTAGMTGVARAVVSATP